MPDDVRRRRVAQEFAPWWSVPCRSQKHGECNCILSCDFPCHVPVAEKSRMSAFRWHDRTNAK